MWQQRDSRQHYTVRCLVSTNGEIRIKNRNVDRKKKIMGGDLEHFRENLEIFSVKGHQLFLRILEAE